MQKTNIFYACLIKLGWVFLFYSKTFFSRLIKKQLIKNAITNFSIISLFVFSVVVPSQQAFAADVTISSSQTSQFSFTEDDQKLTIDSDGDLSVSGSAAVLADGSYSGLEIEVNADSGYGISTTGNYRAISIRDTAELVSLTLNSGTITSSNSNSSSGETISLGGEGSTTIITSSGTTISNTSSTDGVYAIKSDVSNSELVITNAGTISTANSSGSFVINLGDSDGGSSLALTNTGTITAGTDGTAVNIASSNVGTITNSGTITGDIVASSGELEITSSAGSITGDIALGTSASSYFTLSGGSFSGAITGSGTVNFGTDNTLTGAIGTSSSSLSAINITSGTLTAGSYDIYATTTTLSDSANLTTSSTISGAVNLGSGSTLTLGTGAVSGAIIGSTSGYGTVNFTGNNTLSSEVGGTKNLNTINLSDSVALTGGANSIRATSITLGDSATLSGTGTFQFSNLTLGDSASITRTTGVTIDSIADVITLGESASITGGLKMGGTGGYGTLVFDGDNTLSTAIVSTTASASGSTAAATLGSSTDSLAAVNITSGTLTAGSYDIYATTTTLSDSANLTTSSTISGAVNLGSGSTLTLGTGAVSGAIDGSTATYGTINFTDSNTLGGTIGATKSVGDLNITSGTLTAGDYSISAANIALGSNTILTTSAAITGDIAIGSSATLTAVGSSTAATAITGGVSLGSGGILNLGTADSSAGTTSYQATVSGDITADADGYGTINLVAATNSSAYYLGGDIGAEGAAIGSVVVNSNRGLRLNGNDLYADTITLANGTTLYTTGGGTLSGTVQGSSNNYGSVDINSSSTILASGTSLGVSGNALSSVLVRTATTLDGDIYAYDTYAGWGSSAGTLTIDEGGSITGAVTINNDSTLTLNASSSVTGTIKGSNTLSSGTSGTYGNLVIAGSGVAVSGAIGSTQLKTLTLNSSADLTASSTISAAAISIGSSATLTTSNAITGAVSMDSGSTLTLGTGAVSGAITPTATGNGIVNFTGNYTMENYNIGANNVNLSEINIEAGVAVTSAANSKFFLADTITLKDGTSSSDAANLTTSGGNALYIGGSISSNTGTIYIGDYANLDASASTVKFATMTLGDYATFTQSSALSMSSGQTLEIGKGAVINKGITATSSGGTITFTGDNSISAATNSVNSNLGTSDYSLTAVNISSGATLTMAGNIYATNTTASGTLDLDSVTRTITGNLAASGSSGAINLSSGSHIVTGTLTLPTTTTLETTLTSSSSGISGGAVAVTDAATTTSTTNLDITFSSSKTISSSTKYAILTGSSSSSLTAISSSNININGTGQNKSYSGQTFTTSVTDNSSDSDILYLVAGGRSATTQISSDKVASRIYDSLMSAATTAADAGASDSLTTFLTYVDSASSSEEVVDALRSAAPQVDNGVNRGTYDTANASVNVAQNVLDEWHGGFSGLASGDESENNNALWMKGFGTNAKQDEVGSYEGYNSNSYGFAVGSDKEVFYNTILGGSLSYANSSIKSTSKTKTTSVDTYQLNLYGGHDFRNFFIDAVVGAAWNQFSSSRVISAISSTATGDYDGQTYIAKLRGGTSIKVGEGFEITPELMLTFAHNKVGEYTETGAGTMNLHVNNSQFNFLEGRAGLNFNYNIATANGGRISPKLKLSYGYDFIGDRQFVTSNFVNQASSFTSESSAVEQESLKAGAGLDIYQINSVVISGEYGFEYKLNYQSHTGSMQFRYYF